MSEVKKRKCSDCQIKKDLNFDNFYKSPTNKTGLTAKCKECFDLCNFKKRDKLPKGITREPVDKSFWMNGDSEIYC